MPRLTNINTYIGNTRFSTIPANSVCIAAYVSGKFFLKHEYVDGVKCTPLNNGDADEKTWRRKKGAVGYFPLNQPRHAVFLT